MDALKIISEGSIKAEKPQFNVGDTVRVDVRIKEGERERTWNGTRQGLPPGAAPGAGTSSASGRPADAPRALWSCAPRRA